MVLISKRLARGASLQYREKNNLKGEKKEKKITLTEKQCKN